MYKRLSNMEELSENFASSFQVTIEPNTTVAPHPRFSQYKGRKDILDQNERRRRILLFQKEQRFDYLKNVRRIETNDWSEDDDEEENKNVKEEAMEYTVVLKKPGRFYQNQLMLSEWLVEVPTDLEMEWLLVICPVGKRCLVIATKGITSVYTKNGYLLYKFPTMLPGGNKSCRFSSQDTTILDCLFNEVEKCYYILDVMSWSGYPLYDSETEFRFYWIHSKFVESHEHFKNHSTSQYKFVTLPNFPCTKEAITNSLAMANFPVDGVLFYHKRTHYTFGSTPLVLWLKPYMLPELLEIPVPETMLANKPTLYSTYAEHLALVKKDQLNFFHEKQETVNLMDMGPPPKQKRNRGKKKKKKRKPFGGQMDVVDDTMETGEAREAEHIDAMEETVPCT